MARFISEFDFSQSYIILNCPLLIIIGGEIKSWNGVITIFIFAVPLIIAVGRANIGIDDGGALSTRTMGVWARGVGLGV